MRGRFFFVPREKFKRKIKDWAVDLLRYILKRKAVDCLTLLQMSNSEEEEKQTPMITRDVGGFMVTDTPANLDMLAIMSGKYHVKGDPEIMKRFCLLSVPKSRATTLTVLEEFFFSGEEGEDK